MLGQRGQGSAYMSAADKPPQCMHVMCWGTVQAMLRIRSNQKPLHEDVVERLTSVAVAVFLVFVVTKLALARALGPTVIWADLCVACAGLAFSVAGVMSTVIRSNYPKVWFTDAAGALAVSAGVLVASAVTLVRLPWWRARFWTQRLSPDEATAAAQLHMHAPGGPPGGMAGSSAATGPRPSAAIGKWGGDSAIPPLPQFVQAGVGVPGARTGGPYGAGASQVASSGGGGGGSMTMSDTFATTFHAPGSDKLSPPAQGASTQERLDFIQHQLDGFGTVLEILEGLRLAGLGPSCRLQGGWLPLHLHCTCLDACFRHFRSCGGGGRVCR